ncbi:MAG: TlpA disulfide reductase family protein [Campylobacterota bacterium]|nr:TlpA disulfide reductase family protein [Campylobacterota bacterium]
MKTLLLFLLIFTPLFAYEQGSTLDDATLEALQINDDRTYIVDFFASWCHSCEEELPELNDLHQDLDSAHYELVGIDIDKDVSKAKAFQESLDVSFRVINDSEQKIVSLFKPVGMPSLYIIKDKKVLHVIVGAVDNIDEVLRNYLGVRND